MTITFDELLFQLKRDAFYGFLPVGQRPSSPETTLEDETEDETEASSSKEPDPKSINQAKAAARKIAFEASLDKWIDDADADESLAPTTCALLLSTYKRLRHIEQARLAWKMFHGKFFKDDIHRELIYLWCSFLKLPAYQNNRRLDWNWCHYINDWNKDFEFKDDELREFLRGQRLPLPTYYFYDEPDHTGDPAIVDSAIAALKEEAPSETSPTQRRERTLEQRDQHWEARINELAEMPEHSDKTHEALCEIVAGELIGKNASKSTIMRRTTAPRRKK